MSNAKCQDIILARIGMTGINDQNDFFGSKIICIFFQKKKLPLTFSFFFTLSYFTHFIFFTLLFSLTLFC